MFCVVWRALLCWFREDGRCRRLSLRGWKCESFFQASAAVPRAQAPPAALLTQHAPPEPPRSTPWPPAVKRLNGSTTAFRNYGVAHAVGAYTAEEAAATAAAAPAAAEQPAGEGAEPAADGTAQDGDKPAEGAEGDKPAEPAKPKQEALIVSIAQSSVKQMRPGDRPPEWMRQGPAGGPYRPVPPGKR